VTSRPRRIAAAVALAVALLVASAAPASAPAATPPKPGISAETAVVIDGRTGETLYAKRANKRHAIASTTKIVTALVAREGADLGDMFTASDYKPAAIESQLGLKHGEKLSLRDLLKALMLPSANDAAMTIAEGVAGSRSAFVDSMNSKAGQLGLDGTSFANPIGLDDPDNYSTAHDLALAARQLLRDPALAKIVDSPHARLTTGAKPRTVTNRNRLVAQYPWVNGVKTGHTRQAGYVLVGSATRGGVKVISVVTGEPGEAARDTDSLTLLRYGLAQYRRARVVDRSKKVATAKVEWHDDDRVDIVPAKDATLTIRRGERVRKLVEVPGKLEGPLPRGKRVGVMQVSYRDKVVRRIPLVTAEPVRGATTWQKVTSAVGGSAAALAFLALAALAGLAALRVRNERRRGRAAAVRGGRRR
jgi:serine-type D-Ala-D-Ala carboxypeptidase (penicillin-binding protein 5/6)